MALTLMLSYLPNMPGSLLPVATPTAGLSDDEQRTMVALANKLSLQGEAMRLHDAYYEGTQRIRDLGISTPPTMAGIRTVVDWPRICIDPLAERQIIDGFRLPGQTEADDDLMGIWQANNMDAEAPLTFLDSLVYGRGYMIVGSPDTPGDPPLITADSALNIATYYDARQRRTVAAYQSYEQDGIYIANLYLPDVTIRMSRTETTGWVVDNRDEHHLGQVAVTMFPNRARTKSREGRSEITPAVMNTTDAACRTLLGMEIAREFYSVPQKYVLGVQASDFVDSAGNPITAWQASMDRFLALERDETGQAPTAGQFTAYDPATFTKVIDSYAQLMSSYTGFPPSYFGQTSTANPASADAIRVAESGINRRARHINVQNSDPVETVMRLAWRIANGGAAVPEEFRRMATDWAEVATQTPAATSDAMFKQVQMGAVPPKSDVVLKRLGYNAVERQRLAQDAEADEANQVLQEITNTLAGRAARTGNSILRAGNPQQGQQGQQQGQRATGNDSAAGQSGR